MSRYSPESIADSIRAEKRTARICLAIYLVGIGIILAVAL